MEQHFAHWDDADLELAVLRATEGLAPEQEQRLRESVDEFDLEEFEQAVAAIHLGAMGDVGAVDPMPAAMAQRMERVGRELVSAQAAASLTPVAPSAASAPSSPAGPQPSAGGWATWGGWLAAAALLLVFGLRQNAGTPGPPIQSVVEPALDVAAQRGRLIEGSSDIVNVAWTPTEDVAAQGATGDVVWSVAKQEGYMRFEGLEANDPQVQQYQLWIFDQTRADWEAKPVDGGVFDVTAGGSLVVPIDAKLAVGDPVLFAVTVEVPGGVVVSERERIVLTASPGA